ncbi:MAG TPA: hypothetical protein VLF60_05425 [Candidatus Saccharimonadales bacterium]|nr:hypothetical protein [Candidatus Saccharimonadales bacterium]
MEHYPTDTIFSLKYSRKIDTFFIYRPKNDEAPPGELAFVSLGGDDFIVFLNEAPGELTLIAHRGDNQFAIDTLARVVFDREYKTLCKKFREETAHHRLLHRQAEIVVPFSTTRRRQRIALHASSIHASQNVKDLHDLITLQARRSREP